MNYEPWSELSQSPVYQVPQKDSFFTSPHPPAISSVFSKETTVKSIKNLFRFTCAVYLWHFQIEFMSNLINGYLLLFVSL